MRAGCVTCRGRVLQNFNLSHRKRQFNFVCHVFLIIIVIVRNDLNITSEKLIRSFLIANPWIEPLIRMQKRKISRRKGPIVNLSAAAAAAAQTSTGWGRGTSFERVGFQSCVLLHLSPGFRGVKFTAVKWQQPFTVNSARAWEIVLIKQAIKEFTDSSPVNNVSNVSIRVYIERWRVKWEHNSNLICRDSISYWKG